MPKFILFSVAILTFAESSFARRPLFPRLRERLSGRQVVGTPTGSPDIRNSHARTETEVAPPTFRLATHVKPENAGDPETARATVEEDKPKVAFHNYMKPEDVAWFEGQFFFRNPDGRWFKASKVTKADKDVDGWYKKGDVLFEAGEFGWFKAAPDTQKITEPSELTVPNPDGVELTNVEQWLVHLANAERVKRGLNILVVDPYLTNKGREKATNMAANSNMSHQQYPSAGQIGAAENIAMGQPDVANVTNVWMNSSGHRANMLDPRRTKMSASYSNQSSNGRPYWVQLFR